MPYVNKPRPYKKEYQQQVARGEHDDRMERQRARRSIDERDTGTVLKTSPKRKGKDVAHVRALSRGGSNADGVRIESASTNRSFRRGSSGEMISETSKRERRRK